MYKSLRQRNKSGFTLVEIIIAASIFVIAIGMMYGVYISGVDIYDIARYQAELQAQARYALNYMVSELLNATRTSTQDPSPNLSIPSKPNNKSIHFRLPEDKDGDGLITDSDGNIEWNTNDPIDYQYIPGQKVLRRLEKGEQIILARDVEGVQFIDIDIDSTLGINELKIILTLTKTTPRGRDVSVTLCGIVRLRN